MFKDLFWRRLCSNEGITLTVYLLLYDMTLWAVMWCDPKVIGQDLFCEENGIKMKQKLTFALLIYEQKKKTAVKKGCDLLCKQVPTLQRRACINLHVYIAAYRQKFLNQLYYSNGKIIVRKK